MTVLGSHEKPVRCVEYNASTGTLLSGGWDSKINSWDPRSKQPLVQSRQAPGKVRACARASSSCQRFLYFSSVPVCLGCTRVTACVLHVYVVFLLPSVNARARRWLVGFTFPV